MAGGPDELIELICAASIDREQWSAALNAIADAIGAHAASLTIVDRDGRSSVVAPRSDPEWLAVYRTRWARSNVVRDRGSVLPIGAIYDFETLGMPRSEFNKTEFYNEFFAPQSIDFALVTMAARESGAVSATGFYRPAAAGRFGEDERNMLQVLGPHIRRAVSLNLRMAELEMQRDSLTEMLNHCDDGALLVDSQARVLFANRAAEAVLNRNGGLRSRGGRLTVETPSKASALRALIAGRPERAASETLMLDSADGGSLAVEVIALKCETGWLPQRPAAVLFIKDPKPNSLPSRERIRDRFGLTRAQAGLARELLRGDGIPGAAARLGISRSTARTHLLELFQKTGTNRQAELVRLIMQQVPPENPEATDPAREDGTPRRASWRNTLSSAALQAATIGAGLLFRGISA